MRSTEFGSSSGRSGRERRSRCRARSLHLEQLESRSMMAAFDVLVFTKAAGFVHESRDEGIAAIQALGAAHDFSVTATEDANIFSAAGLAPFEAVIFLNTTGDVLNAAQETAFQNYIHAGGGYAGIHSASDTEYGWAWYGQLVGAYFAGHPAPQQATIKVADRVHASTKNLPERWILTEELYNFNLNPRGDVHVLMTLDETTYSGGTMGFDHPFSWYHYFDGGRAWYTGLGHSEAAYTDPLFLNHLLGGILYAAGRAPADEGATIDDNWRKVELATSLSDPVALAPAADGRIFFIELGGAVKIHTPGGQTTTAGTVPVFRVGEDGMLAIALDPNFAQNNWLYLYYSPAGTAAIQRLSRFTMNGNTLDLGSEIMMLEIPVIRPEHAGIAPGHSGASLAFGPGGLLYLSTGDNTPPYFSGGFTPIDERPGREWYDAQRTAGNTHNLVGKILRIKPEANGTYSIPAGNLFPANGSQGRPEIYIMGNRNPFRISIDPVTGWLYWGDVGPDSFLDNATRGPRGYDEINQARQAGNYGWPYMVANNKPYIDYDFTPPGTSGAAFNPAAPVNNSPNNTGATNLPAGQSALIWYPYAASPEFPELGSGTRTAMAGPVYNFNAGLASSIKLPEYLDGTLIIYDWSRSQFWEVKLDQSGNLLKINRTFRDISFKRPMDAEIGPDGALYVIEWGTGDTPGNTDAKLVRIEFTGNLPVLSGDYNRNNKVDAADYTIYRNTLGSTIDLRADGNGNGRIDPNDYAIWAANFGAMASPFSPAGGSALPSVGSGAELPIVVAPPAAPATVLLADEVNSPTIKEKVATQPNVSLLNTLGSPQRQKHRSFAKFEQRLPSLRSNDDLTLLALDRAAHTRQRRHEQTEEANREKRRTDDDSDRTCSLDLLAAAIANWR